METTAETNPNNRELTTTEVQIVIAQIQDRLTRYVKAERELYALLAKWGDDREGQEGEEEYETEYCAYEESMFKKIREKHDIPDTVFMWGLSRDGMPSPLTEINAFAKPYIAAFVKGKLTTETKDDLVWFFDEIAEYDYGWILIEQPFGYYGVGGHCADSEEIEAEITRIGTRSKSKAKNLPRISYSKREEEEDI
jgi:hypothetical protein